jgi:hypothetical protein
MEFLNNCEVGIDGQSANPQQDIFIKNLRSLAWHRVALLRSPAPPTRYRFSFLFSMNVSGVIQ